MGVENKVFIYRQKFRENKRNYFGPIQIARSCDHCSMVTEINDFKKNELNLIG